MATKHLSTSFSTAGSTLNVTKPLSRFDSKPLDSTGLYESKVKAEEYSKGDSHAYVGQIVTAIDSTNNTTKAYQIKDTTGNLREFAYIDELDSSSTEASAGSFLTQVTITDGKISGQKTESNAATASKWQTTRTITLTGAVTSDATSIDGSSNVTINTTTNHNHDDVYINVTGDTMTGPLAFANGTYNAVGDDICFGDINAAGVIALKSLNNENITGIVLQQAQGNTQGHIKLHFKSDTYPDYFEFSHPVCSSSFNATSDARLKENFQELKTGNILDLPTYKFDYINGAKNQIGCKAQDLQKICPEIVDENSDGYLSIQESKIVYLLLEEVKKLRGELDELRKCR